LIVVGEQIRKTFSENVRPVRDEGGGMKVGIDSGTASKDSRPQ
jgi:hypothetical protein